MMGRLASLKQMKALQALLLVSFACGALYAGLLMYGIHKQLRKYEAMVAQFGAQDRGKTRLQVQKDTRNINDQLAENSKLRNVKLNVSLELQKKYQAAAEKKIDTNLQNKEQHRWLEHRRKAIQQQQQQQQELQT